MSNQRKLAVALLCSIGVALTAASASAMPVNLAPKNAAPGVVDTVRWGGGWRGGGWRGGGWRGGGWGLGGFAAGAIIGGAIAAPYYYGGYYPYSAYYPAYPAYGYPPPPPPGYYGGPGYGAPVGPAGADAGYCAQRYRSYDPSTGTFLGNDGQRHPCP